jgi:hypothetical protein
MKLSLKKSQFLTGLRLGYLFVCHFEEVDGLSGYQFWVGYFCARKHGGILEAIDLTRHCQPAFDDFKKCSTFLSCDLFVYTLFRIILLLQFIIRV